MAEIAFELRPFLKEQGQLISLPAKNKKKLLAIWYLAERIPAGRTFTEAEINDAIDDQTTFRDHATLRRELGWQPKHTDFSEGLDQTIAWYTENRAWWEPVKAATEAWYRALGQ